MIELNEQREQCKTNLSNAESREKKDAIQLDTIYNEDCLEGMKRIEDGSIDCIICDLPYEVLHKNNPHAQWDRIIPFEPLGNNTSE